MKKAQHTTKRESIENFQQLKNVGPATAGDFVELGLKKPSDLIGADPWQLYEQICDGRGTMLDPCCLDVFMSAVDYMNGNPPREWWSYTEKRKHTYGKQLQQLSSRLPR